MSDKLVLICDWCDGEFSPDYTEENGVDYWQPIRLKIGDEGEEGYEYHRIDLCPACYESDECKKWLDAFTARMKIVRSSFTVESPKYKSSFLERSWE